MTSNLILPDDFGIWTPGKVIKRYGPRLGLTAGALYKFYGELYQAQGRYMTVPIERMLAALHMSDTPECRDELKRLVNEVGLKQQIGTRMEHGVVSVWFSPEVERLSQSYEQLPGGLAS